MKVLKSAFACWCMLGGAGLFLIGCGPGADAPQGGSETPSVQNYGTGSSQRQADFLNQIREADPSYQTIQKAVLNERNELGIILGRGVQLDSIPGLMRSLFTRMAREFPNQDLTIIAYAPSQPPARIGTAHFNARTHQMTYTPEHATK